MAQNFNNYSSSGVGTSDVALITGQAGVTTTVIGLSLANIKANDVSVSIKLNNVYIAKNATVPVGTSMIAAGNEQKIVLKAGDVLKISASEASAIDAFASTLELS